ncbi:MAG: restriction endonuclease subunit S [Candidatus Pacebacteria bacterium]|nr:restriction endonuclease subunit S [Candidatus Paceibacterota bacterium]
MKYINVPQSIAVNELVSNHYSYAPSKYSAFYPKDKSKFDVLSKLVEVKNEKEVIKAELKYRYVEIGDIDTDTGQISYKESLGVYVPNKRPLKIARGDILVSTVRTYRKGVAYVNFLADNIVSTSAFLVLNQFKRGLTAEYLLALLRSDFFVEQILSFQNRGMYPRLDNDTIDSVYIPIPTKEQLEYLTLLQRSLFNKQGEIEKKHKTILDKIEKELLNNQRENIFVYEQPNLKEIGLTTRIDGGYYCEIFKHKQFLLLNYTHSAKSIDGQEGWGYELKRGQNLQESAIGKIIESDTEKMGFYKVIRPTNFSEFGTVASYSYLGNAKNLSTLEPGDIVFSAEGTVGKCVLFVASHEKAITNIHGIILNKKDHNIEEISYISCFLRFLREWNFFEYISVGGQGGSLAMQYWKDIKIPNFPLNKQKEIARLYCNQIGVEKFQSINNNTFLEIDSVWNQEAGIIQIDEMAKKIQTEIDWVINQIILGAETNTDFRFLCN